MRPGGGCSKLQLVWRKPTRRLDGALPRNFMITPDGKLLLDSQVENLVQAMAAFAPPAAGQTILPPAYQETLATVIAANWQ